MVVRRCEECGEDEYMPYVCKFCGSRYCSSHRLPENHTCTGLDAYKARLREEGRLMAPEPSVVSPQVSPANKLKAGVDRLFDKVEGRGAMALLAVIGATFLTQMVLRGLNPGLEQFLFVMGPDFYLRPWTILTSIVAHANLEHFFFNGLVLFFFGPTLERIIGSRKFLYLFIGSGVAAGLSQVVVFDYVLPAAIGYATGPTFVLGASGGIMGILGALTVLAPNITVLLFFVIPTPLWIITIGYAALDILGVFNPGSTTAHVAHLVGLGIGLAYGKQLRDRGLRVRSQQGGVQWGRYF